MAQSTNDSARTAQPAQRGGRTVGGIIGILYTSVAFGTLLGPSAAGFAFDISHSYFIPVAISAAANLVAALIAAATMRTASPIGSVTQH